MTKLYILLKAHATKTIMVPGYTRKDGTIVPPHQKVVHYDPDKSQHDVINGRGNNVQKMAHKQAQKHDHYHKMSDEDKHNYILHLATDIHNQRMRADALARFKAGFKDGKLPQVSQYNAFMNESKEDQEKILSDLRGKFGNERVDAVMSAMAEKSKGTGKKAPKKTTEKKPELTLEHTTPEQLKQEDEARQAEAKRKEAEEKAAAQREQADKESENFTLTGSDSMRDQAAAHGQQDMLDAFDGKDEKKPEKITNDAKGLKTLISTVDEDHAKILKRLIRTSRIHFDDRDPVSYDTPFLKVWLQRNHKGMVNGNIQIHDTFKGWNIHHFDNVPFDDFVSAAYGNNKPDADKIKSLMLAIKDGIFGKQAQAYAGSMEIYRDEDEHYNESELRAFVENYKKQLGEATAKKIEEFLDGNSKPEKLEQKHSGSQVHDNGDGTYTVFTPLTDAKYIGGVAANAKKMDGKDDYWHKDNRPDTLHRGYMFGSKDKAEKFQKWLHDNEPEMKYQETMRYADKKFNNWYEKTSTIGNAVYEYGRLDPEKTQIHVLNNTKVTQDMPDGSKFSFNLDRHRTFEKEDGVWKNERNTTKAIESRKKRLDKRYIEVDEFKQQIAQKKADGKETSLDEIRLRRMERDVEYEEKSLGVDKPKEGDTKTIDGITYVLQGGRWHRQTEEVKAQEKSGDVKKMTAERMHSVRDLMRSIKSNYDPDNKQAFHDNEEKLREMLKDPQNVAAALIYKAVDGKVNRKGKWDPRSEMWEPTDRGDEVHRNLDYFGRDIYDVLTDVRLENTKLYGDSEKYRKKVKAELMKQCQEISENPNLDDVFESNAKKDHAKKISSLSDEATSIQEKTDEYSGNFFLARGDKGIWEFDSYVRAEESASDAYTRFCARSPENYALLTYLTAERLDFQGKNEEKAERLEAVKNGDKSIFSALVGMSPFTGKDAKQIEEYCKEASERIKKDILGTVQRLESINYMKYQHIAHAFEMTIGPDKRELYNRLKAFSPEYCALAEMAMTITASTNRVEGFGRFDLSDEQFVYKEAMKIANLYDGGDFKSEYDYEQHCKKESKKAKAKLVDPKFDEEPKEGDTKVIDGVTYVLRDGRWHRQGEPEKGDYQHTRDIIKAKRNGKDTHAVQFTGMMSRRSFSLVKEEADKLGGRYVGANSDSSNTSGFHFSTEEDAKKFRDAVEKLAPVAKKRAEPTLVKPTGEKPEAGTGEIGEKQVYLKQPLQIMLETEKAYLTEKGWLPKSQCTNKNGYVIGIEGWQARKKKIAVLKQEQKKQPAASEQPKEAIKQPDLQENRKTEPENAEKQASERKTEILTNTIDAVEKAFSRRDNNRVKEENRNAAKEQLSKIKASGAEGALIHDLLNPFNSSWKDISGKVISKVKDGADLFDAMTEVFLEKYREGRYVDGKGAWNGGVKSNDPEKVKESFRSQFAGYAEAEAFYREHGKHRWQVEQEEKKARLEKEAEERATPEKAKHNQTILDRLEYLKNNKPSEYDMRKEFLAAQNDYLAYRGALQEVLSGIEENQREVLSSVENYIVDDLVNHYGGSVVGHFHNKEDVRLKALEYYKQGYDIFDAVAKAQDELHKIEDVKSYLERKYESAKKDLEERLKQQGQAYPSCTALMIREMVGKDDEYSKKFIEQVRASGTRNAAIVSIMENSPALQNKVGFGFDLGFSAVYHALDMRDPDTALFEKGAKILNKATGSRKNAASFKKFCEAESEKAKQKLASEPKPKEGDTKVINGVTYVLQGGRWHRQAEKPVEQKPVTQKQAGKEAVKAAKESVTDELSDVGPYKPAQKAPVDIVDSDGNQTRVSENGIQDAGRHMHARKDEFATYAKKINVDFGNQVFQVGKHFPAPNYEKLAKDGADHRDLATLYFIREYVSSLKKPKNVKKEDEEFYKRNYPSWWKNHIDEVFSYNAKVKKFLQRAKDIAEGKYSADDFSKEFSFNKSGERNLKLLHELGYPAFTQAKGYQILESKYKIINPQGEETVTDYVPRYATKEDGYTVKEGKFYAIVNGYRVGKTFSSDDSDNYQAAVDSLRADLEEKAGSQSGKKRVNVRLDCYFNHRKQAFFVGRVISGNRTIELSPPLASKKEVLEYKRNHEAELAAKWKEMAKTPNVRGAVNATRKGGEDWLKGSNATQEQFMSKFNFSGTTYGNWTNQEERQEFLNHMYNCMMDMSQITGIEPGNMSLKGGLGIQYGASGHGRALAHYTPQELAINLTKMKGAGSIAHEWFHALDDHIGRLEGCGVGGFITKGHKTVETPQTHTDVVSAVKELMTAIHDSPFITRSAKLDGYRPDSAAYWTLPHELAARAFESYISDKSEAMGLRNNFLCKYMTKEDYDAMRMQEAEDSDYPYPDGDEKTAINAAFDKLFKALKTAEKAKGKSLLAKAIRRKGLMFLIKKH